MTVGLVGRLSKRVALWRLMFLVLVFPTMALNLFCLCSSSRPLVFRVTPLSRPVLKPLNIYFAPISVGDVLRTIRGLFTRLRYLDVWIAPRVIMWRRTGKRI